MSKKKNNSTDIRERTEQRNKDREKTAPDEGQGAQGDLGSDGDWGKNVDEKDESQKDSAPVPPQPAK